MESIKGQATPEPKRSTPNPPAPSPPQEAIGHLKAVILSIEWEINDAVMDSLIRETERLQAIFSNDFTAVMMLKLLGSVGRYILLRKAEAHQGAVGLLNSVFQGFESMVTHRHMSESEKKQRLVMEIQKFKELKAQIATRKSGKPMAAQPQPPHADATSPLPSLKEELRALIRAEFSDIRKLLEQIQAELSLLKKR